MFRKRIKMLLTLLFIGSVLSSPVDEFRGLVNEGELKFSDDEHVMGIVPSGYSPQKLQQMLKIKLEEIVDMEHNEHYKQMLKVLEKGYAMKGLTFNIYDDNMREAAITLFNLLGDIKDEDYNKVAEWASQNINSDLFDYSRRLAVLYKNKFSQQELPPPFITKPNYFINSETIKKAASVKMNNGHVHPQESAVNQIFRNGDVIAINSNYSGWNLVSHDDKENINYFREDIALNSYYYGVHLLHPFWMSNENLDTLSPRHAEHYYYRHQQLLARYKLEKEHLYCKGKSDDKISDNDYNPYLVYDNGLSFPVRPLFVKEELNEYKLKLKSIDIGIRECISRGILIMQNGTKTINFSSENYIDLLAKLIRGNLDSVNSAKIVRAIYGYGGKGFSINMYTPAPSVLHHPQTSLRDPAYWFLIQYMLNYFSEYQKLIKPYDIVAYQTDEYIIESANFTKITTYFDYYQFNINNALGNDYYNYIKSHLVFTARQKRLKHLPFTFSFNVHSKFDQDAVVRLFLGPNCAAHYCWMQYTRFFELDSYIYNFKEGTNVLNWSPETSTRFSFDEKFNLDDTSRKNRFNMFKFPENLIIPKGLEQGLNLTLFIMVTPHNSTVENTEEFISEDNLYKDISQEIDEKPLGFPFHRPATGFDSFASNYKLFNITVYHKSHNYRENWNYYFSPHLL